MNKVNYWGLSFFLVVILTPTILGCTNYKILIVGQWTATEKEFTPRNPSISVNYWINEDGTYKVRRAGGAMPENGTWTIEGNKVTFNYNSESGHNYDYWWKLEFIDEDKVIFYDDESHEEFYYIRHK